MSCSATTTLLAVQLLLQDLAVDLAVEHFAAVAGDALVGELGQRNRLAVDRRGDARHLLLLGRIVEDVDDLGLLLHLLEELAGRLAQLVLLQLVLQPRLAARRAAGRRGTAAAGFPRT